MKRLCFLSLVFLLFKTNYAQPPENYTSADIFLSLKKLNVLGSVLYVAAHPDDENTRLLSYFSKDRLYRTGYLSMTRGDGGQNLIGDEQGVELGLIRTQELLAARRIDGAEQFFTRAYDFGYSKTPDETFSKWNKEKILADVVWVIRKFQPDVIITRFPITGEGGHGHHTASAILANEAFAAAADASRFPEQLKYVKPWQAKRIAWNTFNFGSTNTTNNDQFHFDVGVFNPVLGKSYGEIASESRSLHKSQGFGVPRTRGEAMEYFKTTGGNAPVKDLLDDVNTSWQRVTGSNEIADLISSIVASYNFSAPHQSLKPLVELFKKIKALPQNYWRDQKLWETKKLIEVASGMWMEAFSSLPYAVEGDSIKINFAVNDRMGVGIKLNKITVDKYDSIFNKQLNANKNFSTSTTMFVAQDKNITQPYWLKDKMNEGYFEVKDQLLIGQPDVQSSYIAGFSVNILGEDFIFSHPVKYKSNDAVKGELYQPLFVIPAATIVTSPDNLLFQKNKTSAAEISLQYNANKKINGKSHVHIKSKSFDETRTDSIQLQKNASKLYTFKLNSTDLKSISSDNLYGSMRTVESKQELKSYLAMRSINYDHIPAIRYFYEDAIKIINLDLQTKGKKIGYIIGAGDKVPDALEQMGYEVTLLSDKELGKNNLQQFDAIISGVRAYNTNEWLNSYHAKLMQYVENGGNLIVQYNTSNQLGPVKAKIGPYEFNISRTRITDENSPVTFLKPEHAVLNFPNKISQDDFKGWVQERSIYHADKFDPHFESVIAMTDPGEKSEEGSLIISKLGKGYFTYTGLAFFRQLPAGVPGSYRLLANLIALNKKQEF